MIRDAIATVRARIANNFVDELVVNYEDGYDYRTKLRITEVDTFDTSQGLKTNTRYHNDDWPQPIWEVDDLINQQLDNFATDGGMRLEEMQSPLESTLETAGEVIETLLDAAGNYKDTTPPGRRRDKQN